MRRAYVIMSNDYPAAVMSNRAEAERFCEQKRADQKEKLGRTQVNWRCYEFKINNTLSADSFHANFIKSRQQSGGVFA